jgi:hypothetical protein
METGGKKTERLREEQRPKSPLLLILDPGPSTVSPFLPQYRLSEEPDIGEIR